MLSSSAKPVPDGAAELTSQWFSSILGQPIRESTLKLTENSLADAGFLSNMIRVEFQTEPKEGQGDEDTFHKLIVKLLPERPDIRAAVICDRFDQTEILTYKTLIPELIKEIPTMQKYFCDTMYGEIRDVDVSDANSLYSSVLVLKDLKPDGYSMVGMTSNMTNDHFVQGLDFLAQLHAASLSLEKKNKSTLVSIFQWFPKNFTRQENGPDPNLFGYFKAGFPHLHDMLAKNPKISSNTTTNECLKEIENRAKHIYQAVLKAGSEYACLVHGDLWSQNILVKENELSAPIKFIDWQKIGHTDPVSDLTVYILFCIPFEQLTVEGVMNAAKKYYDLNSIWMKTLGLNELRTWEQFKRFFETYGLIYLFIWYVTSISALRSLPNSEPKLFKIFEILVEMDVFEFAATLK